MRIKHFIYVAILVGAPVMAQQEDAKIPLKDVTEISEGLIVVGEGDIIRNTCERIDARVIMAFFYLNGLKNRAFKLGYSQEEVEEYVSNEPEKQRLLKIAKENLAKKGVIEGKPETYCTVGFEEIENSTQIGRLLRAN